MILAILVPLFLSRSPGACTAYELQRDTGAGWVAAQAWHGPGPALYPALPIAGDYTGAADTFYVALSQAPRAWAAFRCRCVTGDSVAGPWSRVVAGIPAGAWPDTNVTAWQGPWMLPWRHVTPTSGANWQGRQLVNAQGQIEPDTTRVWVESQTALQERFRDAICKLFGFFVTAGTVFPCP